MPMTYTGIDYPLTPQEIADIASWIDQGAPVPAGCDSLILDALCYFGVFFQRHSPFASGRLNQLAFCS